MFFSSEPSLVKQAQKGNKAAWLKLVKQHEKAIYHYCLRMTGNQDDALDLMQESFISIFRCLANFRFESSFKTWAISIAHRRCVEFFRKKHVQLESEEQGLDTVEACQSEAALLKLAENNSVIAALSRIPFAQREVVELKFFQHYTFDEIATVLGISPNTVKTRLYSALSRLKTELEVEHG